jgi:hypothetical protein
MPGGMGRAGPICFAGRNDGWASVIEKLEKGKNINGWAVSLWAEFSLGHEKEMEIVFEFSFQHIWISNQRLN